MLLFACIFAAAYLMSSSVDKAVEGERYRIGVVGDVSDNYLGFGFTAIKTLDSSRYVVDFATMSEDEALSEFRSGDLIAVIKIPENFTQSVAHGENNIPLSYISSRGLKGIEGYVMDELADVVSELVTSAQTAFFAVDDVAVHAGAEGDLSVYLKEFNLKLLDYILNRGKLVETQELGLSDGLPLKAYYTCALVLMFVFLLGIGSAYFFSGRNRSLGRWMTLRGVGALGQIACEFIAYLILMALCMIIPMAIAGAFFDIGEISGLEITAGFMIARMLPVLVMVCTINFLIYEAVESTLACVLIQFLAVISMAYLSGYIYPAGFFPEAMQALGRVLPTGAALSFVSAGVSGGAAPGAAFLMAGTGVVFFAGTVLLRRRSIVRENA
ncbi:MAG: ABC transporter permease [Lachnospiraceae bacterium]|nr:ABC transporter permease [Lachnospiraceae bacterium]